MTISVRGSFLEADYPVTGSILHAGSQIWRKIHIGIDEETLEVRAIEVTTSNVGDAPMLPELLNQIPADQTIGSVTADGLMTHADAMT